MQDPSNANIEKPEFEKAVRIRFKQTDPKAREAIFNYAVGLLDREALDSLWIFIRSIT